MGQQSGGPFQLPPRSGERKIRKSGPGQDAGRQADPGLRDAERSADNLYQLEFGGGHIGRRDAKTREVTIWPTSGALTRPRRGRVDEQNRLLFSEYGCNGIDIFGPHNGAINVLAMFKSSYASYVVLEIDIRDHAWCLIMLIAPIM